MREAKSDIVRSPTHYVVILSSFDRCEKTGKSGRYE